MAPHFACRPNRFVAWNIGVAAALPSIMRPSHSTVIAAALMAAAALFIHPASASDFPEGSPAFFTAYDAALKAAKDGGKPAVMIFSAVWCPPCQANKRRVYPSAEVKPFHEKFVWAYLDADDKANEAAMRNFGVSGIPHIEFLDKEGRSLGKVVGGTTPEAFAGQLASILKTAGS